MREVAWVVFDEIHYMRDKGQSNFKVLKRSENSNCVFYHCYCKTKMWKEVLCQYNCMSHCNWWPFSLFVLIVHAFWVKLISVLSEKSAEMQKKKRMKKTHFSPCFDWIYRFFIILVRQSFYNEGPMIFYLTIIVEKIKDLENKVNFRLSFFCRDTYIISYIYMFLIFVKLQINPDANDTESYDSL